MDGFQIPYYWFTGLGSWAVSYLLHSSVILAIVLVICYFGRSVSESRKDVLLKMGLVAGIFTASVQFVQSSHGAFAETLVIDVGSASRSLDDNLGVQRVMTTNNLHYIARDGFEQPSAMEPRVTIDWLGLLLACWALGSCLFALRFAWRWHQFKASMGQRIELSHPQTIALCERLKQRMGITRRLRLTQSDTITSPMAIGLSQICLPSDLWLQVDEEQMTAIIAHELAHISRVDPIWLFFWHLMSIVFFFQPFNKLTQLSFQSRAEFLADAMAVRQTKDPVAMVNSLITAAQLANRPTLSALSAPLIGHNATIVARSKMLLSEKLMKTKASFSFIFISAMLLVALSALFLPAVSLATKGQQLKVDEWQQFTQADSHIWTQLVGTPSRFTSNIDYVESVAGKHIELFTRRVVFNYDLDGVADFGAFARLKFVSKSIYSTISLEISVNWQNVALYRYTVDGEMIDDQQAAMQFIAQMLDQAFGESDEFKRKVLMIYAKESVERLDERNDQFVLLRLQQVLENHEQLYSVTDRKVAQFILQNPEVLQGKAITSERRLALLAQFKLPEKLTFFNAMAMSKGHTASFSELGLLHISKRESEQLHMTAHYDLYNPQLMKLYLAAVDEQYQQGESERALVEYLVRVHFAIPEQDIRWLNESSE